MPLSLHCNVRFTQTLDVTGMRVYTNGTQVLDFESGSDSFHANDKIFLQGSKELISEPGEFALEGTLLYYWPRHVKAMQNGVTNIVALTTKRVLNFAGESWDLLAVMQI